MNKLWIGDESPSGFKSVNNFDEAIKLLEAKPWRAICLDNNNPHSNMIAEWIKQKAHDQLIQKMGWTIHNNTCPVPTIERTMKYADLYWKKMDDKFHTLFKQWREETCFLSNIREATKNSNHIAMVAMGKPIVGSMLRYIHETPDHLFIAMREILGTGPEIPNDDRGHVQRMCKIWYEWGVEQGYVHEELERICPACSGEGCSEAAQFHDSKNRCDGSGRR